MIFFIFHILFPFLGMYTMISCTKSKANQRNKAADTQDETKKICSKKDHNAITIECENCYRYETIEEFEKKLRLNEKWKEWEEVVQKRKTMEADFVRCPKNEGLGECNCEERLYNFLSFARKQYKKIVKDSTGYGGHAAEGKLMNMIDKVFTKVYNSCVTHSDDPEKLEIYVDAQVEKSKDTKSWEHRNLSEHFCYEYEYFYFDSFPHPETFWKVCHYMIGEHMIQDDFHLIGVRDAFKRGYKRMAKLKGDPFTKKKKLKLLEQAKYASSRKEYDEKLQYNKRHLEMMIIYADKEEPHKKPKEGTINVDFIWARPKNPIADKTDYLAKYKNRNFDEDKNEKSTNTKKSAKEEVQKNDKDVMSDKGEDKKKDEEEESKKLAPRSLQNNNDSKVDPKVSNEKADH